MCGGVGGVSGWFGEVILEVKFFFSCFRFLKIC